MVSRETVINDMAEIGYRAMVMCWAKYEDHPWFSQDEKVKRDWRIVAEAMLMHLEVTGITND